MSSLLEVEKNVQDYFEVANVDWVLLEELVDLEDCKGHRAIRPEQRLEVDIKTALHKFMRSLYQFCVISCIIEPDFRFEEDSNRGYCGFKVTFNLVLVKMFQACWELFLLVRKTLTTNQSLISLFFLGELHRFHFKEHFRL